MAKKTEFVYTEKVTGEIVQIPVELLHRHHQNPRKDLGDLTELADSIKAKGVLQNLTVVPFWFETTGVGCDYPEQQAEMGYLVVIGNRRLAAAKLAGLETLPCIIAKMTKEEQMQTMLLENILRANIEHLEVTADYYCHIKDEAVNNWNTVLEVLKKYGFVWSDPQFAAVLDGTYELYVKEADAEDEEDFDEEEEDFFDEEDIEDIDDGGDI